MPRSQSRLACMRYHLLACAVVSKPPRQLENPTPRGRRGTSESSQCCPKHELCVARAVAPSAEGQARFGLLMPYHDCAQMRPNTCDLSATPADAGRAGGIAWWILDGAPLTLTF